MGILRDIFLAKVGSGEGDIKSYLKKVESGDFRDRLCYGISDNTRGFYYVDPVKTPGALYCGGMGSGKSESMKFTVVTNFITNSDHTLYILVDPGKGMNEYKALFPYKKNVVKSFNDVTKVVPIIDMVYEEIEKRKEIFSKDGLKAKNVYEYEELTKEKIARIILCFEEFHTIPNAKVIQFHRNYDIEGTVAYKLRQIMRVGRSYGVTVLAATQRATSDDFPSTLKPGIRQMMAFKTNSPGDVAAMDLPHATDLKNGQNGRCAYEGGFIQFPWFKYESTVEKIIKKYYKPLSAKLFAHSVEDFHKAVSGTGNDGMVEVKPLLELIKTKDQYNINAIAKRFLSSFGYEILPQENEAMALSLLAKKDGKKIAVLVLTKENSGKKRIEAFLEGAKILECDQAIALSFDPPGFGMNSGGIESQITLKEKGIFADRDDLIRMAEVLDNKEFLEEKGQFESLYNKLVLSPTPEAAKEVDEEAQDSEDEEKDDLLKTLNNLTSSKKKS